MKRLILIVLVACGGSKPAPSSEPSPVAPTPAVEPNACEKAGFSCTMDVADVVCPRTVELACQPNSYCCDFKSQP
jgi:hypothetical protein